MAKIEKLQQVVAALQARAAKAMKASDVSVVVGFTAAYAVYVHENLDAHHPVGQAKFLEEPVRRLGGKGGELSQMIGEDLKKQRTMGQALLRAGLRIQREAQILCPVDAGALRASAFTRLEKGSE